MSIHDILLPHRLLINGALRTASDKLRAHIDANRIECEQAAAQARIALETAKAEKDRQFQIIKEAYISILSQDRIAADHLQRLILEYADAYCQEQCLRLSMESIKAQSILLRRRSSYLSEHIRLISEEIELLKQRKDLLTQQAKIDDIVSLIQITGGSIHCDQSDTAKSLLKKVNKAINASDVLSPESRNALLRLRMLLQERTAFSPQIQYIAWMIGQRIILHRELNQEQREIKEAATALHAQLPSMKRELKVYRKSLVDQATQIRNWWAVPMAELYIKLAKRDAEINRSYDQLSNIREEIEHMKRMRSNDSDRWNHLQAEKQELKEKINTDKAARESLRAEKDQWKDRRNDILQLFKGNHIYLYTPDSRNRSDEIRILDAERKELNSKLALPRDTHEKQMKQINARLEEQQTPLLRNLSTAQENLCETALAHHEAEQDLKKCIARDNTPFFLARFWESSEVTNARTVLRVTAREKAQAEQKLEAAQQALKTLKETFAKQKSDTEQQYRQTYGRYEQRIKDIDLAIDFIQKQQRRESDWR